MTKSLPISKRMVYNSYLKVIAKDGSAGIDKQSIEMFNENLSDNLYKIWNRMTSGSYFPPPVRTVFIPKKQGGKRPLGIPTVGDRIAQGVVNPQNPYERYADDIVIHCSSKEQAEQLLENLKARMQQYELELHPEKTKIVYCKNYQRHDKHDNNSFTFLSYSFQPRTVKDKFGRKKRLVVFNAAISQQAKTSIRGKLREVLPTRWSNQTLEWFAEKLNPKIRGWVNYYAKFNSHLALDV